MTNPEHEPYDDIGGWLVACGLLVVIVGLVLAGLLGLVALVIIAAGLGDQGAAIDVIACLATLRL